MISYQSGILKRNEIGRFTIVYQDDDGDEGSYQLTSGDVCEVLIGGNWIPVRVESNDNGYYMTTNDESFRPFLGMRARFGR